MADLVPMSQAATTSLVTTLQNTDLFALAREDITSETGYRSKVARVDAMAKKVVNETDYSQLQTTNKKIIGAINEVNAKASQFDNMTATASGSIATFTDGGDDIPVSEYECEIVAQQASGTPTPASPLPITGFSQADISVCGKNLFDSSTLRSGDYDGSNPTIRVSQNLSDRIKCVAGTTYTFSFITGDNNGVAIFVTNENNVIIETINLRIYDNITFTPTTSGYLTISFLKGTSAPWVPITPTDCQNLNPMVEISNTATTYEAYKGNTYLVEFGQTIYGGKLVYENGEWSIEATHNIVDLGTLTWTFGYGNFFYATLVGLNASMPVLCEKYEEQPITSAENQFIFTSANHNIYIKDTSFTPDASGASALKTSLNGSHLVYGLLNPIIIPITSSTRVKTISGVNNIFSNTGDNSVKYFTENADSLAELIKAFVV